MKWSQAQLNNLKFQNVTFLPHNPGLSPPYSLLCYCKKYTGVFNAYTSKKNPMKL